MSTGRADQNRLILTMAVVVVPFARDVVDGEAAGSCEAGG
jgi:hypothetical protein